MSDPLAAPTDPVVSDDGRSTLGQVAASPGGAVRQDPRRGAGRRPRTASARPVDHLGRRRRLQGDARPEQGARAARADGLVPDPLRDLRSLVTAGMPILTALVGVGVTLSAVVVVSSVVTVSSTSPTLAEMLGLAVGIDYALFILSRYRAPARATACRPPRRWRVPSPPPGAPWCSPAPRWSSRCGPDRRPDPGPHRDGARGGRRRRRRRAHRPHPAAGDRAAPRRPAAPAPAQADDGARRVGRGDARPRRRPRSGPRSDAAGCTLVTRVPAPHRSRRRRACCCWRPSPRSTSSWRCPTTAPHRRDRRSGRPTTPSPRPSARATTLRCPDGRRHHQHRPEGHGQRPGRGDRRSSPASSPSPRRRPTRAATPPWSR